MQHLWHLGAVAHPLFYMLQMARHIEADKRYLNSSHAINCCQLQHDHNASTPCNIVLMKKWMVEIFFEI